MPPRDTWFVRRSVIAPRLRLFCFSHAGGSAADYLPWHPHLGPHLELCAVQLPGRGSRMAEPARDDLATLVTELVAVLRANDDGLPFAFFGHSLGALLAFELTRSLHRQGMPLPLRLFASGCAAPSACRLEPPLHTLDDEQLLAHLRDYNGTPAGVLANPDLLGLVLPTLRADFRLVGDYRYRRSPPLPIPIHVFTGHDDPHVPGADLVAWADETSAGCSHHGFAGDHFFIRPQAAAIRRCILDAMATTLNGPPRRAPVQWQ
ncbi:thioesterase II family protein [Pseudomonas entomophila]|uniref:Thioesterase domain-containing protein n=2 Tax=Pseudomonas entomophila TaxID=312306 RepID=A0ABY9QKZ2_9PSED|nr:alpha/beta fold hydrolase [Pseudomonas entomophila]WMW04248.1 thioesterase domain-containing protein [Pseudomonas entomophila]CAK14966.1 putative thioesterase [Pseudomonas entomophila L48]